MTNSQRFLDAYNATDKALHNRFGFKPSLSFSDAVRRAATMNSVVRKFEDDLVDFGRLRNAIVHKSNSSMTIAEPHDDVTARFERIASVLSEPPKASTIAHKAKVVKRSDGLRYALELMSKLGFSNLPVIDGGSIVGILTNKSIVSFVGKCLGSLDSAFERATVGDAISENYNYFAVMPNCNVDDVLDAFERNRKLSIVIITENGTTSGKILGVITTGDLVTVSKMLE